MLFGISSNNIKWRGRCHGVGLEHFKTIKSGEWQINRVSWSESKGWSEKRTGSSHTNINTNTCISETHSPCSTMPAVVPGTELTAAGAVVCRPTETHTGKTADERNQRKNSNLFLHYTKKDKIIFKQIKMLRCWGLITFMRSVVWGPSTKVKKARTDLFIIVWLKSH